MRICYIADGISIHTQKWVNYFARNGHEVHLISSRFPFGCEGYDKRIKMYPLVRLFPRIWKVSGYLSGVVWLLEVRELVKKIKPDVLDAHFITICGYLGVASGFHPLVLTAWGSDILITAKRNPFHRYLTKYALKRADCIVCVSSAMKQEIINIGAASNRVRITFTGVDSEKFSPMQKDETLLQKLGIHDSSIVISTRSLSKVYNVETLIKAIPLVLEKVPEANFIIVGKGNLRAYLESLASSLGIIDNIRFVGWVPHNELPKYIALSDVYVSTSLSDGTSQSLLEAMACGVAPVVTDIGANQPWVKDGENGFLFRMSDYKMLAARITFLMKNHNVRTNFGKISKNIVREKAEFEKEMIKVEEIYREVIKAKSVRDSFVERR